MMKSCRCQSIRFSDNVLDTQGLTTVTEVVSQQTAIDTPKFVIMAGGIIALQSF